MPTHPITRDLLAWYDDHRRSLPWRDEVSPYRTWISEVMLQQTRVETVLPYFARFLARFPTVESLAAAPADDVLALWSGLGYYSRARNMHAAAKQIVAGGGFPKTLEGLRELPGVGEYMAGAIGSIALGLDAAAIDGNLHRVLARLHRDSGDRKAAWKLAEALLPQGRAGDFNQALMDLGSRICTPKSPSCPACPLNARCAAYAAGDVLKYPVKPEKRAVPEREAVCGAWRKGDALLLVRRPAEGLYGGLYELPGAMLEPGETPEAGLKRAFSERLGLTVQPKARLGAVQHVLSHMRLTLHVVAIAAQGEPALEHYTDARWVAPAGLGALGTSTLARKAIALVDAPEPEQKTLF